VVTAIEEGVPAINKTVAAKATEIATSKTALSNTQALKGCQCAGRNPEGFGGLD
jgi:hypothetical protein